MSTTKNRPAVKNTKTGDEVLAAVEASPLRPQDAFFEFGDLTYWCAWIPQNIKDADIDDIDADQQNRLTPLLALPEVQAFLKERGGLEGASTTELMALVTGENSKLVLSALGATPKELLVKAYAASVVEWNVTDLEGEDLPLGVESFYENGGVYDAALSGVEKAFLLFKNPTSEAPAETPKVLSANGDTLSTAPETTKTTAVSGTSRLGQSGSGKQKSGLASQAERA